MFKELLMIVVRLSAKDAAKMEKTLMGRFRKVARTFRGALNLAIKGSVVGISLGLLTKLLNPLEKITERIEKLFGDTTEFNELAAQMGTTPGRLRMMEDAGQMSGVTPEQFKTLLEAFVKSMETAREELADPMKEKSAATEALRPFVGMKDQGDAFMAFLASLQSHGEGPGRDVFFSEREQSRALQRQRNGEQLKPAERARLENQGLLKHLTGEESRGEFEKLVFGQSLKGSSRSLLTQLPKNISKLGGDRRIVELENASGSIQRRALTGTRREVTADQKEFIALSGVITDNLINRLADRNDRDRKELMRDFSGVDDLLEGDKTLAELTALFNDLRGLLIGLLGELKFVNKFIPQLQQSRFWRGITGRKD